MKLFTTAIDYPVKKVLATAALAGVKVEAIIVKSQELLALHPEAASLCLENDSGTRTVNIVPIIKAVATSQGSNDLIGGDASASVDQWLEFTWKQLGTWNIRYVMKFAR